MVGVGEDFRLRIHLVLPTPSQESHSGPYVAVVASEQAESPALDKP